MPTVKARISGIWVNVQLMWQDSYGYMVRMPNVDGRIGKFVRVACIIETH